MIRKGSFTVDRFHPGQNLGGVEQIRDGQAPGQQIRVMIQAQLQQIEIGAAGWALAAQFCLQARSGGSYLGSATFGAIGIQRQFPRHLHQPSGVLENRQ